MASIAKPSDAKATQSSIHRTMKPACGPKLA